MLELMKDAIVFECPSTILDIEPDVSVMDTIQIIIQLEAVVKEFEVTRPDLSEQARKCITDLQKSMPQLQQQ